MHDHPHADALSVRRLGHRRRLALALALAASYMLAEVVGGLLTNSLALLADAGHMFSDAAALALSLFASWMAERPAGSQRTYGHYRIEILAAMANGGTLIAVAIYILFEAWQRLQHPPEVWGGLMMAVAWGGLGVNLLAAAILSRGRHDSLNLRGAWLHVLTDALGSVGAIVAGAFVWAFGWHLADPIASALIALLVVYSAWRLVMESAVVLLEIAPRGIDVEKVRLALLELPGVCDVHDLHVWTITSGLDSLSAHMAVTSMESAGPLLFEAHRMLHERFGVGHLTIQIEPADFEERACAFENQS